MHTTAGTIALTAWTRRAGSLLPLLLLVAAACSPSARAGTPNDSSEDRGFGGERCVTIRGYAGDAMEPFISRDGRYLLFNSSNAPDAQTDLQVARLENDSVARYVGPLPGANSAALDGVATTSAGGALYFVSTRSFASSGATIYTARLTSGGVDGVTLVEVDVDNRSVRVLGEATDDAIVAAIDEAGYEVERTI